MCSRASSQLTGGGRLARVDVADNDDIDMSFFLTVEKRLLSICVGDDRRDMVMKGRSRQEER